MQLHHIDDDPSNNDLSNLAALCLECHRETQIVGGFDRKLNAEQVTLYRDDWLRVVAEQRAVSSAETDRESVMEVQLELATSLAEIYREKEDWTSLAVHYHHIGNEDLRDKYVEIALQGEADDAEVLFLRGLQGRPDLIPEEVADRELARRADWEDWSQRARALAVLSQISGGGSGLRPFGARGPGGRKLLLGCLLSEGAGGGRNHH